MRRGGDSGIWIALAAAVACLALGFTVVSLEIGEDFAIPGLIALAIAGTVVLRGPLGKALARRLEGVTAPDVTEPLAADLDELRGRVFELEERLDFAERLLARQREGDALPRPGDER